MYFIIISFIVYFSFIAKSFAYIDPGTGSIILQALMGLIAATIATISFYWSKFKMIICKLFKKDKKGDKN